MYNSAEIFIVTKSVENLRLQVLFLGLILISVGATKNLVFGCQKSRQMPKFYLYPCFLSKLEDTANVTWSYFFVTFSSKSGQEGSGMQPAQNQSHYHKTGPNKVLLIHIENISTIFGTERIKIGKVRSKFKQFNTVPVL